MVSEKTEKRDSRALEPQLVTDPQARAKAEARNVLRQYDAGIAVIQSAIERGAFKLRPSLILALHREALFGISMFAGNFRPAGVEFYAAGMSRSALILYRNWPKIYATTLMKNGSKARRSIWHLTSCGDLIGYILSQTEMEGRRALCRTSFCPFVRGSFYRARLRSPIRLSTIAIRILMLWMQLMSRGKRAGWMFRRWKNC